MREGTSGVWVTEENGKISIGYTDFVVSTFGDSDYEKTYTLDEVNAKKFKEALEKEYSGTLYEMVVEAFGKNFNDPAFWNFCKQNEIEYSSFSWMS